MQHYKLKKRKKKEKKENADDYCNTISVIFFPRFPSIRYSQFNTVWHLKCYICTYFFLLLHVWDALGSLQPPGIIKCSPKCLKCFIPLGVPFLYLLLNTAPTDCVSVCASAHTRGTWLIIQGTACRDVFSPDSPGWTLLLLCDVWLCICAWMCVNAVRCSLLWVSCRTFT